MRAIAEAYKERSLAKLILTMAKYPKELKEDPVTKFHLDTLYDKLLENNLSRLIEPFSQVCCVWVGGAGGTKIRRARACLLENERGGE